MNESSTTEEVTTIETQAPQVVRKTTVQTEPQAKGDAPQKVYNKKKTILRFNQIIWYVLCLIEVLLVFRVSLKALGANQFSGFTSLIYAVSDPLALPFQGILRTNVASGGTIFEWSTIIAGIAYLCLAWGLVYLLDLIYPISPKDVETQ